MKNLKKTLLDLWYSEKEKLKNNTWQEKVSYILQYYWTWIVTILVIVSLVGYVIWRSTTAVKENWLFVMFANTREDVGNNSELWNRFEEKAGLDLTQKNLEFNNTCYFDPTTSGGTGNSYYQSFVAFTEVGTLDVLTLEREDMEALGSSGRLLDLESDSCKQFYETYKDRLVYSVPYDEEYGKDLVPIGIDISDSILMTEYHIYPESCVFALGAYSQHLDAAWEFLQFVLE